VLALDIDGVILRDAPESGSWSSVFSETFDVDASLLQESFFGPLWPDIVRGRLAIEPALGAAISSLGWGMTVEDALKVWFDADFHPDLDVIEAVEGWARDGVRVVLVSNQEHRRVNYLQVRLASLLNADIAYSADVGYIKSEQPFYTAAEKRLGISGATHNVVFVDDALENVTVANAWGWTGLHFVRAKSWTVPIEEALAEESSDSRGRS
jgi:FMN phosphatase YigB (HAD superfamily)